MLNAIISVYNKDGLIELANNLIDNKYFIWSSGGTYRYLQKYLSSFRSKNVFKVQDLTKFPEILNGRVKTLHPCVYGGILADHDNMTHKIDLESHGLKCFDLVVVNLYPFSEVVKNPTHTEAQAIENIDIGGVSLIRAAAKNYKCVNVLTNPNQYNEWINSSSNIFYRKQLAKKAFHYIADYDIKIADYLDDDDEIIYRIYKTQKNLKYGLNPNQKIAKLASINDSNLPFTILNGNPGYINMIDAIQSWKLVSEIQDVTGLLAISSFKHTTPTGVALGIPPSTEEYEYFGVDKTIGIPALTFLRARDIDPLSSFGDFLACSCVVNLELAKKIKPFVSDGIIAKGYEKGALELLEKKKGGKYIILESNKLFKDNIERYECREYSGLTLIEEPNNAIIKDDWFNNVPTSKKEVSSITKHNLIIANILLKYTPSNSIAYSHLGRVVAVGAGQQNRVDCVKLAGNKWINWLLRRHPNVLKYRKELENKKCHKKQEIINKVYEFISENWEELINDEYLIKNKDGVCLASDGFFPFQDNIEVANEYGVKYIIQPGGSIADSSVVESCDSFGITMVMSGHRMFYH